MSLLSIFYPSANFKSLFSFFFFNHNKLFFFFNLLFLFTLFFYFLPSSLFSTSIILLSNYIVLHIILSTKTGKFFRHLFTINPLFSSLFYFSRYSMFHISLNIFYLSPIQCFSLSTFLDKLSYKFPNKNTHI